MNNKLGSLLLQMPPSFKYDGGMDALQSFIPEINPDIRHAIEFRHKSWFRRDVYDLLEKHDICLCWSLTQYVETPPELTSNFIYVRMVGDRSITKFTGKQKDRSEEMKEMHSALDGAIDTVDDAFVFFNNHFAGFGPESVNEFRRLAGMMEVDWTKIGSQASQGTTLDEF